MRFWKVSHGPQVISEEEHNELLAQNCVRVHSETQPKGRSSIPQGEAFTDAKRTGDVFYLCRGNDGIELLGVFTGGLSVDAEGWATRQYEILKKALTPRQGLTLPKWWAPSDRSTFMEIPAPDYAEFEAEILKPRFGLTIKELEIELRDRGERKMKTELVNLLRKHSQLILTGAPGTGKTHLARDMAAEMIGSPIYDGTANSQFQFVQFHPSYDYSDFVQGLKPVISTGGQVGFALTDGIFKRFCDVAQKSLEEGANSSRAEPQSFVFIIDEINRADLSRVFGELFFAIERDYRGRSVETQFHSLDQNRGKLSVPKNVYIIGTMNDIDRSVESFDFALRRRFVWREIAADANCFDRVMQGVFSAEDELYLEQAKRRYLSLNEKIGATETLGESYKIGPAYFRQLQSYEVDGETMWDELWRNHLVLLVREYLRGVPDSVSILEDLKSAYNAGA